MISLLLSSSIGLIPTATSGAYCAGFHLIGIHMEKKKRYPYGTSQQSNTLELIHDAFQPLSYWNGWETPPNYQGVAMDTHIYQMFSNSVRLFCPCIAGIQN